MSIRRILSQSGRQHGAVCWLCLMSDGSQQEFTTAQLVARRS